MARDGFNSFTSQVKTKYKKIGKMLLEAYIEQRKRKGAQAAAARKMEAEHPGVPPQAISCYFTP